MPNVSHIETCSGALVLLNLCSILFYIPTDSYVPRNAQCQSYWNICRCIGILEPLFYTTLHTYRVICTKEFPMLVIFKHVQVHWYSWTFVLYYFTHLRIDGYQEMPNVSHIETCSGALVLLNLCSMLFSKPTDSFVPSNAQWWSLSNIFRCIGTNEPLFYAILHIYRWWVPRNSECWSSSDMFRCIDTFGPFFYTISHLYRLMGTNK